MVRGGEGGEKRREEVVDRRPLLSGERCGALTYLCESEAERKAVESQIKILVRPLYSNPPIHGARVATEILTNPELYKEWYVVNSVSVLGGVSVSEWLLC